MVVTINFYDQFGEFFGDGSIDLDGDTFTMTLHNALTFTATHTQFSNVSASELGTGGGYTAGGQGIGTQSWATSSGTQTFDDDGTDVIWNATTGGIGPATDGVLFDNTHVNDLLACDIDFDGSFTAGDGTDFRITFHANGIFTLSKT